MMYNEFPSLVRAFGINLEPPTTEKEPGGQDIDRSRNIEFGLRAAPRAAKEGRNSQAIGKVDHKGRAYVAFIGGGGKTTLMMRFAVECLLAGFRVLVTTTTKMYVPSLEDFEALLPDPLSAWPNTHGHQIVPCQFDHAGDLPRYPGTRGSQTIPEPKVLVLDAGTMQTTNLWAECAEQKAAFLEWLRSKSFRNSLVVLGGGIEESSTGLPKLIGVDPNALDAIWTDSLYDFVLAEADGAAGRPLKAHRPWEPVIPKRVTHVVCAVGADAVDVPASNRTLHTLAQASESWGLAEGDRLSSDVISEMIMGENGARSKAPEWAEFIPVVNKVDDDATRRRVLPLVRELLSRGSKRVVLTSWGAAKEARENDAMDKDRGEGITSINHTTSPRRGETGLKNPGAHQGGAGDGDGSRGINNGTFSGDFVEVFTDAPSLNGRAKRNARIGAVILAAGASKRLGCSKPLLTLGGITLIERSVREALRSKVEKVVVVTGCAHEAIENVLATKFRQEIACGRLEIAYEPRFEEGQSMSLKRGISCLDDGVDAALLILVDQPFITSGHLHALIKVYEGLPLSPGRIVVPVWEPEHERGNSQGSRPEGVHRVVRSAEHKKRGNPVLIDRKFFGELMATEGDVGGREVLARHPEAIKTVNLGPEILWDIDTWEDYKALLVPLFDLRVLIRGAGDLASGVAYRLHEAGLKVVMTEIERPSVIRRTVAFAEAVFDGKTTVEGVSAVRVSCPDDVPELWSRREIPVLVDPELQYLQAIKPHVLIDAIMAKRNLGTYRGMAPVVIALGPGFEAPREVDAVVETERGHYLGRVIYHGSARPDTGVPGPIAGYSSERLIRAPADGVFFSKAEIGDYVHLGDVVGYVGNERVTTRIAGVLRGLIHDGLEVRRGMKIGDVDPRNDPQLCFSISDKARAVGGGVLEALLHLLFAQGRIREVTIDE